MTQPTALDIPSEVQQLLQRYVKETTSLLGSQLEGILLYGSAVGGEFLPGRSNLNLLLMLSNYDREGMQRYAKAHKRWSREQFVVPLLVTEAELTKPGTVFPLEYLEIQEQHRVLWGRDPFIGLHIDRTHLAYQVQQGIQGNLVRLRQLRSRMVELGRSCVHAEHRQGGVRDDLDHHEQHQQGERRGDRVRTRVDAAGAVVARVERNRLASGDDELRAGHQRDHDRQRREHGIGRRDHTRAVRAARQRAHRLCLVELHLPVLRRHAGRDRTVERTCHLHPGRG